MKNIFVSAILAASVLGCMTSCEDMMSPKSGGYLYDDDLHLNTPNDSLYSIAGLMTKVQQLGERYVLFGELRGDMVSVSSDADLELQELSNFTTQSNDTYTRRSDFYAVINHCNWIISKMDPTVTKNNEEVLADEYAAARLYRAWTYLQLGLAYGQAEWITEPLLSLEDTEKSYPVLGLDELVRRLIDEVEPLSTEERPNFGDIDGTDARNFFLVPSLFLADLYLYDGQYDNAARMYWYAIQNYRIGLADNCIHFYNSNTQRLSLGDVAFMTNYRTELITTIPYSTEAKGYHTDLINLTYSDTPAIYPSQWWIDDMADRTYYFGNKNYVANTFTAVEQGGDLRAATHFANDTWSQGGSVSYYTNAQGSERNAIIGKFYVTSSSFDDASTPSGMNRPAVGVTSIALVRAPHVYLRFAEAVNRLGKPTLAYAVVRYGLNSEVIADDTKVDPAELESGEQWLDWSESFLDSNIGTGVRGRGYGFAYHEAEAEELPDGLSSDELMLWVEDVIVDELASETAYEGNRFFDLVRVAKHRGDDSWFADKVSRRFADPAAVKARLADSSNWFIR